MHADEQKKLNIELRSRQGQLETIAKGNRATLTLGKGIGLGGGLGVVWMLTIANPAIGAVVGAIALVNYAAAAMKETEKTGEFRPLLGRKSLSSLAQGLNREGATPPPTASIEDDALYLDDRDLGEWLLLRTAMPQTIQFLSQCPEENRDEALDLAATEAYRSYGYLFRAEPDTRHQMKREQVGQYAFAAVRQESGHLLEPSAAPTAFDNDQNIGMNTRLGAIAVPATVSNGFDVSNNPFTIQPDATVSSVNPKANDIVDLLLGQGNSLAFFGAQRSGKSRLMAIASQEGVRQGKFKHVTVLSGLAKQDEDPEYWDHSSAKGFHDLAPMARQEVDRVFADWLQKINGFRQSANVENPGLLIIDEYVYTASRCASSAPGTIAHALAQAIVELVTVVESGGAKRGWHLWIGCPSCAISGMGDMGKAMKKLQLVYCAIAKGETVDAKGIQVSWNAELFEAVKINYKSLAEPQGSEAALQGRIVFFNGRWMPQTSFKLGAQSEAKAEAKPDEGEIARAAAMVKALYQSKAQEHPNMSSNFLNLAAQVKVLKDEGHHQKAFAVMIAPIGKTKTAFCHNLGVKGGTEFQKLSAVYDWAQVKC